MSYAVQADLLQRVTALELVQLTDDSKPPTTVNATTVQGALDEATGMIDSYVRSRYQTPLQTSNTATSMCRDIAIYLLYARRPQAMKETARQRYEDAVATLKDISTGKASLDQPATATVPQSPTASYAKPTCDRQIFGKRDLEGFI